MANQTLRRGQAGGQGGLRFRRGQAGGPIKTAGRARRGQAGSIKTARADQAGQAGSTISARAGGVLRLRRGGFEGQAGQARASYPEKMQKNDQNPPAKNPSYHVKVELVCGGGCCVYNYFFIKKLGYRDRGDFPEPTHQHTSRHTDTHADTPTRRPRTRGTHTANTHTGRGLEGGDGRANTGEGASSIKATRVPEAHCGSSAYPVPRLVAFFAHEARCRVGLVRINTSLSNFIPGPEPPFPALYVFLLRL